jgi:outer membrane protein assembly factor BamA
MRSLVFVIFIFISTTNYAAPAVVKSSIDRLETSGRKPEKLILPYLFTTDTMGLNVGVGAMASGYYQDQMSIGATAYGGDVSSAVAVGLFNYRLPGTDRLYLTINGMLGYFPEQRAYSATKTSFNTPPLPGSNASSSNDYIQADGSSNWWDIKLEYSLPLGATKDKGIVDYQTRGGLLVSEPSGGETWNPLVSGSSVLMLRGFNRYQSFEQDNSELEGNVQAFELGLLYDNTDFHINPSEGSKQYISISHNPSWKGADHKWTFIEFEASKYFSLGESSSASQRIIALNMWTGYSPTWELENNSNGEQKVLGGAPYNEGATLGGFYRMRGYDQNRFHDKASFYTTAEYRHTFKHNPIANVAWLQFLSVDWFQLVGYVEAGRVAPEYKAKEIFSDLKSDVGMSLRAMTAGIVVRADIAVSAEGTNFWVMVDHPF